MNDIIEQDDERLDELLMYQSMARVDPEDIGCISIEEKYEEEILLEEITDIMNEQIKMDELNIDQEDNDDVEYDLTIEDLIERHGKRS